MLALTKIFQVIIYFGEKDSYMIPFREELETYDDASPRYGLKSLCHLPSPTIQQRK
jgi:hypothetical protein